jgi:hypothetical protein
MGYSFGDFMRDVGGPLEDIVDAPYDALKQISHDFAPVAGEIVKTGGNLGGKIIDTSGKLIDKGLGSFDGLVNMIPYILVGGVVLLVMTKGGKSF